MKIGLVLPTHEDSVSGRAPRYEKIRDMALRSEAWQFDSIWVPDHLLYRPDTSRATGVWECWTLLAACAEATRRVELGSLVACVPFRNPALLAKMAVTLDEVSCGRAILGVGAGWHAPEFEAFGVPFSHRVDRFAEALRIIRPLLTLGEATFEGAYYQARDCRLAPAGPRAGGPPLLVGGTGPRMMALAAQYADMWHAGVLSSIGPVADRLEAMRAACARVGRDPANLQMTISVPVAYPDLGPAPPYVQEFITGSADHVAAAWHAFAAEGVSHVMIEWWPHSIDALARLAEALCVYRQQGEA